MRKRSGMGTFNIFERRKKKLPFVVFDVKFEPKEVEKEK
jgi:hypothetical protein